jgi:hypothetical protein
VKTRTRLKRQPAAAADKEEGQKEDSAKSTGGWFEGMF